MPVLVSLKHVETKEEVVNRVSRETDFDPQIVRNVLDTETGRTWDCDLVGSSGELGCYQIIPSFHPNVDPLNFEEATRYFISEYKAGREWQWVGCSCVKAARLSVANLPRQNADAFQPNSTKGEGKLAILEYSGKRHVVAYRVAVGGIFAPKEGNKTPCLIKERFITDQELRENLIGFWKPIPSSYGS